MIQFKQCVVESYNAKTPEYGIVNKLLRSPYYTRTPLEKHACGGGGKKQSIEFCINENIRGYMKPTFFHMVDLMIILNH